MATDLSEQGWVYGPYIDTDESINTGVVKRNTNLRQGPSSSQPIVRMLQADEPFSLVNIVKSNNYYHVKTAQSEDGWAYAPNITITNTTPPPPPTTDPTPFIDAHEGPTPGWTGPVFKLSQDYPATLPSPGAQPWKNFDFKTQSSQYLKAVLDYCMEGNLGADWVVQNNAVRKWYHAPWLDRTNNGREFVHGLTLERSSSPRTLHPNQSSTFRNFAVGIYNPIAGYVIGQVWKDHENPDPTAARFPDGSVACKLLFTAATVAQVPYLHDSFEWDAFVAPPGSNTRSMATVRLLQIDIAVRDSRADATTGWVFGTFAYDGDAAGATPWDRMTPIGLMWGNDPALTQAAYDSGARPQESTIPNRVVGITQHLGWLERLNGPVDNPVSSCLSCHSTAQYVAPASALPTASMSAAQKMRYFRNIKAGNPFDTGQAALDYSLQLSLGIKNFYDSRGAPVR